MGDAVKKVARPIESEPRWAEWVHLAMKGERQGQTQLIGLSEKPLYRFCFYLCGHRELAQDLTQETLIKALEKIKSLDKPDRFLSWAFVIARNLFLDHKKSSQNQDMKDLHDMEDIPSGIGDADRVQVLAVRKILGQLTEDERFILISVDVEGLSYEEVAASLGISEEALKSRVYRARQEFIKKMKEP